MLATSFLPLAILILSVLGAILGGLATPSEAASIGAIGGLVLASSYQLAGFFSGTDKDAPPWASWELNGQQWGLMPCLAFGAFASFAILVLVAYVGMFFGYAEQITEWPAGIWAVVAVALAATGKTAASPVVAVLRTIGAPGPMRLMLLLLLLGTGIVLAIAQISAWSLSGALSESASKATMLAVFIFGLIAFVLVASTLFHWLARNISSNRLENKFLRICGMAAVAGLVVAVVANLVTPAVSEVTATWHFLDAFVLGFPLIAAIACGAKWNGMRESVYLTVRTTAMVCWLFVGSWTFSSVFSYLGGEHVISEFVAGLDLSPLMFLILAQLIIFLLGWPLEWSEIVIIFVPIFLPLLPLFEIDPLFFGILVALNLQTSFLTPPMAMSAYYLKGIAPPHVKLVQIFSGCMPFLMMVFLAMIVLYVLPGIVFLLPELVYG